MLTQEQKIKLGTPKNLEQAVANALKCAIGLSQVEAEAEIKAHIKDFLSQKFSVAMIKSETTEEGDHLRELFIKLVA